ncbi:hypothetical protein ACMSWW_004113 [Cronobacter turicensis]
MKLTPSLVLIGCVMFSVPVLDGFLMGGVEPTSILRNKSIMLLCCFDYCLSARRYFKYK